MEYSLCWCVFAHCLLARHRREITTITLKTPLVPVQGQLLFPMAVTEKVAGAGLPDQPHPHCPQVKTTRLFLPSSAEEAQPGSETGATGVCGALAGVVLPQSPFSDLLLQHTEPLPLSGSCCLWISLLEVETWPSLAGAQLLLLLPLPQPGSWGCAGWSLLLICAAAWECPAPPHQ